MRFSIRDLLLVTVFVAVCMAWWVDHWRQAGELRRGRLRQVGRLMVGLRPAEMVLPASPATAAGLPKK